jgi:hypothetical protein
MTDERKIKEFHQAEQHMVFLSNHFGKQQENTKQPKRFREKESVEDEINQPPCVQPK